MYRYGERRALEWPLQNSGFISDGSVLNEWAYGKARTICWANGPHSKVVDPHFDYAIDAFWELVMDHARTWYDDVIHLPIEFDIVNDSHRPVSQEFRETAGRIVREAWDKLGKNVIEVTWSIPQRIDAIVRQLGLHVSPTLNGWEKWADDTVFYAKAEDALWDPKGRFFSNGFRNAKHDIHNIMLRVNKEDPGATALVDVSSFDWSKKNGQVCEQHFTSIDAILISGQLIQMLFFEIDNVKREHAGNVWLKTLSVKPWRKPLEDLKNLPVKLITKETRLVGRESRGQWRSAVVEVHFGEDTGFVLETEIVYQTPKKIEATV